MSSTFEYDSWKSLAILVQSSVNAHSPWRIGRKTAEAVADDIIAAGWTEAATQSAAVQVNAPDLSYMLVEIRTGERKVFYPKATACACAAEAARLADVDPTDESEWWICKLVPEAVAHTKLRAEKKREAGQ